MEFDLIIRVVELIFTFIGLIFVVFGWIIPYRQSLKAENDRREYEKDLLKRQWEKELVDKQISEFYGPISEIIREQDILFSLILYQLGRDHVFKSGNYSLSDLSENDQKVWVHYVDNYKIPTQMKIVKVIRNNQHLIYKSEVPTCFNTFLEYALGWELLDNQAKNGVPNYYEYYYSYNYPREFDRYIINTLKTLLAIQAELIDSEKYHSTAF